MIKLPKIGDTIDSQKAIELCRHFGFEKLAKRIEDNLDKVEPFEFDGCSWLPDKIVSKLINVPTLTLICLWHDLKYMFGEKGNDEERLMADYQFGIDLLNGGAAAEVSLSFFGAVQVGGGEYLRRSFSWGAGWKMK